MAPRQYGQAVQQPGSTAATHHPPTHLVVGVQAKLVQHAAGQQQAGAVGGSVVGQANSQPVAGQLIAAGRWQAGRGREGGQQIYQLFGSLVPSRGLCKGSKKRGAARRGPVLAAGQQAPLPGLTGWAVRPACRCQSAAAEALLLWV
jgi:hypothetical protein